MHKRITLALAYLAAALYMATAAVAQGFESLPFILRPPGTTTEAWVFDANGDLTVGAATDIDLSSANSLTLGSVAPSVSTSTSFWIPATAMKLPTSNPAAAGEEASLGTLVFADSTADDHAWFSFIVPPDATAGSTFFFVQPFYNMPSGTPAEGLWNLDCLAIADDDADAAASTGSQVTALDTPTAADDWNLGTALQLPLAVSASGDTLVACDLYHDVDDPFGGAVELAGVKVTYTRSSY